VRHTVQYFISGEGIMKVSCTDANGEIIYIGSTIHHGNIHLMRQAITVLLIWTLIVLMVVLLAEKS
jgi:hypothetical protein